jgi:hypothetical protein
VNELGVEFLTRTVTDRHGRTWTFIKRGQYYGTFEILELVKDTTNALNQYWQRKNSMKKRISALKTAMPLNTVA